MRLKQMNKYQVYRTKYSRNVKADLSLKCHTKLNLLYNTVKLFLLKLDFLSFM